MSKESQCIVNRIKGARKPHLSLTNVSPGHGVAGLPPAALRREREFLINPITCEQGARAKVWLFLLLRDSHGH